MRGETDHELSRFKHAFEMYLDERWSGHDTPPLHTKLLISKLSLPAPFRHSPTFPPTLSSVFSTTLRPFSWAGPKKNLAVIDIYEHGSARPPHTHRVRTPGPSRGGPPPPPGTPHRTGGHRRTVVHSKVRLCIAASLLMAHPVGSPGSGDVKVPVIYHALAGLGYMGMN